MYLNLDLQCWNKLLSTSKFIQFVPISANQLVDQGSIFTCHKLLLFVAHAWFRPILILNNSSILQKLKNKSILLLATKLIEKILRSFTRLSKINDGWMSLAHVNVSNWSYFTRFFRWTWSWPDKDSRMHRFIISISPSSFY